MCFHFHTCQHFVTYCIRHAVSILEFYTLLWGNHVVHKSLYIDCLVFWAQLNCKKSIWSCKISSFAHCRVSKIRHSWLNLKLSTFLAYSSILASLRLKVLMEDSGVASLPFYSSCLPLLQHLLAVNECSFSTQLF